MIYSRVKILAAQKEHESGRALGPSVLAAELDIRRPTVSRWFSPRGLQLVDAEILYKFCEYFGVGVEDVIEVRKS